MNIELLSPGGSFESTIGAFNAGADAVYTGGRLFGARAGADNLSDEQLLKAIDFAHIHGKKLYLTVNTLLKDREIESELYDYIAPLYERGLDAVIVQDIGVAQFIFKNFKGLHVHASTQMTIFGPYTAVELEGMGVSRVVLPRELSLKEIKNIHDNSNVQIECFVHGALCYCYSGQCFMSSYIGGRSGNRGRCAQPCRMEYNVISDGNIINPGNNKYVLSPKDICTLRILPQIIQAGVYSLKIEGRMKNPEYIVGATSIYRKYIDMYENNPSGYKADPKDMQRLNDLFNRNGFSESYYNVHNDKSMISLKKPEFRKENKKYNKQLREMYLDNNLKRDIDISATCVSGEPLEMSTVINDKKIAVMGDVPSPAINKPITEESIDRHLRKTGETEFNVINTEICLDNNLFVPVGALNELRRELLDKAKEDILKEYRRTIDNKSETAEMDDAQSGIMVEGSDEVQSQATENNNSGKTKLAKSRDISVARDENPTIKITALVQTFDQFLRVIREDCICRIYIDCYEFSKEHIEQAWRRCRDEGRQLYIALPHVFRQKDKEYFRKKYMDVCKKADGVLVRNQEELYYLKNLKVVKNYILDYNVHTYNKYSKSYYGNYFKTTSPLELNQKELSYRGCAGDEMIVYGYMPSMITAGCCLKTFDMCSHENKTYEIDDRLHNRFKTQCYCSYCYNVIYNCKPLSLFKYSREIAGLHPDSVRVCFTFETDREVDDILKKAEQSFVEGRNVSEDDSSTRGHFKRGVL